MAVSVWTITRQQDTRQTGINAEFKDDACYNKGRQAPFGMCVNGVQWHGGVRTDFNRRTKRTHLGGP